MTSLRQLLIVIIGTVLHFISFSQAPESFNYQAVIRDPNGAIVNNQLVGIQLEILQGGINGTTVYTEIFESYSNAYGLIKLEIGTGLTNDNFSMIDWGNGPFFISTSVDLTASNSYSLMGTSQFISVPYALHATTAEFAYNDSVDDADCDPTNEIQDISLSGSNLSLSNGSTVDLSGIGSQITEATVDSLVANNGYLTSVPSSVRSILLPPSMFLESTFGGGAFHGFYTTATTIEFKDSITGIARLTLPTPADWNGTPMTLKILYTSDGTSGGFHFVTTATHLTSGQSVNQPPTTIVSILPPPNAQGLVSEVTTTLSLSGQTAPPDAINLSFRRFGTNLQDLSTSSLHILGFVLDYTTW